MKIKYKKTYFVNTFNSIKWGNIFMKYRILIEQDEEGMFVAECTSLPGCISQGISRNEALANIKDAIEGYLTSLKKHNESKS